MLVWIIYSFPVFKSVEKGLLNCFLCILLYWKEKGNWWKYLNKVKFVLLFKLININRTLQIMKWKVKKKKKRSLSSSLKGNFLNALFYCLGELPYFNIPNSSVIHSYKYFLIKLFLIYFCKKHFLLTIPFLVVSYASYKNPFAGVQLGPCPV